MITVRRYPGSTKNLLLRPSPEVDPDVLKLVGALKRSAGWVYPNRYSDIALLERMGLTVETPDDLDAEWEKRQRLDDYLARAGSIGRELDHPSWPRLDGHQKVGVGFLMSRPRALLAFSPGLGKSATAIVAAESQESVPILLVAPLTLLSTWKEEIREWGSGLPVANLRTDDPVMGWNLINPDQLKKRQREFERHGYGLVVYDESVLYKNRKAVRTKAAKAISKAIPVSWMLSGSPITSYADDLWAQLNILYPEWFRSYWRFAEQWTFVQKTNWGTQIVGNRHPKELRIYLRDTMISRTPEEVPVLPENPLERIVVDLTPRQEKALKEARDNFEIEGVPLPNVVTQLTRMAQIVSHPRTLDIDDEGGKMKALKEMMEWVETPVLVWCWFKDTVDAVSRALEGKKYRTGQIHGGIPANRRAILLDDYKKGEIDALVMQISTGKFGLSLTNTKNVIFYDRSFGLDDWVQATARVRRRSSKGPVPTYVLDGGWTDRLINVALKKKLRSVTDLGVSDLLKQLR